MKTNPNLRADGSVFAFEIPPSFFTQWPLTRLLRSIEGVSEVEAPWISPDIRLVFTFQGEPCVVKDDSDRYWVGPANVLTSKLDLTPVHQAFQAHRHTALRRWAVDFDTLSYAGGLAPGEAFAVAVAGCVAYFSLVGYLIRIVSPPVPALAFAVLPFVCCGLFHYMVVRNSGLPKPRQWAQIAGSVFFAPLIGLLLVVAFALVYRKGP